MIRVLIGSSDKFSRCNRVILASIFENTTEPVQAYIMEPERLGVPYTGCTGFTNLRYAIPEICGYQGFAIYLDVDMLVLGDIAELWNYRQPGAWVQMEDGASEVAVIDCAAHPHLPPMKHIHHWHKSELAGAVKAVNAIPRCWNVEDKTEPGMKLLHFTDLKCQPWFYNNHPCAEAVALWNNYEKVAEQISVVPEAVVGLA